MNEFTAKKWGEVLAFQQVGSKTIERASEPLRDALGEDTFLMMQATYDASQKRLLELTESSSQAKTVEDKAAATGEKLRAMQNLYLKEDDWTDAAEVLEWLGFFEGAAIVHYSLALGTTEALTDKAAEYRAVAVKGRAFHEKNLLRIADAIQKHSKARSQD